MLVVRAMADPDPEKKCPECWTTAKLVQYIATHFGRTLSRETLRRYLKKLGFSWKKAKKLLNKADPKKREEFLLQMDTLMKEANREQALLVYLDEAHKHPDTSLGYGWALKEERLWVSSNSKQLADRVSLYGLYLYNEGQVRIWDYPTANQENTMDVLQRLRQEFPQRQIRLVWDGASYHRAKTVYQKAGSLGIQIVQLPAYSPDFMPVEELWSWLREELTDHHCFQNRADLLQHVRQFQNEINQDSFHIADRLWRTMTLNPEIEKLRFSN